MRYLFLILFIFGFSLTLGVQNTKAAPIETAAKQAIVLDYDTGAVLLDKNADEQMPTSSMSKVMTMVVVFDALKSGHIKLDDTLLVSEKAWRKQGSKMFVEVNKRVKVEDLIRGVIIQSGNDATIVLAEGLAGTEDAFASVMNEKAAEIGMNGSHFMNASGWPDPNHYSTARDLAKMAQYLITEFPEYYSYYSEKEFTFNKIKQGNRNPLLYRKMGADGIKTGHTEAGGYGVIGSGERDGRRVIIVVNGLESSKERAQESAKLLEWGLQSFETQSILKAGEKYENVEVPLSVERVVSLVSPEDIVITVPKLGNSKVEKETVLDIAPKAPIKKGQRLGVLRVSVEGYYTKEFPLVAGHDVQELGFFWRMIENLRISIMGK